MNKQAQLKALAKRMKPIDLRIAIGISEGLNQQDAYRAAGGKAKNARDAASKAVNTNCDISIYVEIAKEQVVEVAQERGLWSFEKKAQMLEDMMATLAAGCTDKDGNANVVDANGFKGAMSEHNRMTGDLAAIKTDNKTAIDLSGYSDAQLKVMADG